MSNVRKLMIFVAAFGLSFVGNAFADEQTVDTQSVTQTTTEVTKEIKVDENKTAMEEHEKKVEERKALREKKAEERKALREKRAEERKAHREKMKAELEKEMQAQKLNETDKQ